MKVTDGDILVLAVVKVVVRVAGSRARLSSIQTRPSASFATR